MFWEHWQRASSSSLSPSSSSQLTSRTYVRLGRWALIPIVVVVLVVVVFYRKLADVYQSLYLELGEALAVSLTAKGRIIFTTYQMIAQYVTFLEVSFPQPFKSFMATKSIITFDFGSLLPIQCFVSRISRNSGIVAGNAHSRLLVATTVPFAIATCIALSYARQAYQSRLEAEREQQEIQRLRYASSDNSPRGWRTLSQQMKGWVSESRLDFGDSSNHRKSGKHEKKSQHDGGSRRTPRRHQARESTVRKTTRTALGKLRGLDLLQQELDEIKKLREQTLTPESIKRAKVLSNCQRRHMEVFLWLTYIALPTSTVVLFEMFQCTRVDVDTALHGRLSKRYLRTDMSIDCESDIHQRMMTLAIAGIIIYPVGISLSYFVFLFVYRTFAQNQSPSSHLRRAILLPPDYPSFSHVQLAASSSYFLQTVTALSQVPASIRI